MVCIRKKGQVYISRGPLIWKEAQGRQWRKRREMKHGTEISQGGGRVGETLHISKGGTKMLHPVKLKATSRIPPKVKWSTFFCL